MKKMVVKAERFYVGLEDGFDNIGGNYVNTIDGKRYVTNQDFILTCTDHTKFILNENLFALSFSNLTDLMQLKQCPYCQESFKDLYVCKGNCLEDCNCKEYE